MEVLNIRQVFGSSPTGGSISAQLNRHIAAFNKIQLRSETVTVSEFARNSARGDQHGPAVTLVSLNKLPTGSQPGAAFFICAIFKKRGG